MISCFVFPSFVLADTVQLRALLPDPLDDEGKEWILLQNSSTATISGELCISDGAGATKSYCWESGIEPGLLYLNRADTKISLNNDLDWVELRHNGNLIDASEPHENIPEGYIWTRLSDGWRALSQTEFSIRLTADDWETATDYSDPPSNTPSPTPMSSPLVSPKPKTSPSPTAKSISNSVDSAENSIDRQTSTNLENDAEFPYQSKLLVPKLQSPTATLAAYVASPASKLPDYPGVDGQTQQAKFREWQRQALGGSYLLLLAGFCFELVSVPILWRWYNDRRCIW